jgi:hypothetical protein
MADKIPPHDIDAEEAVIGSLLIDGMAIEKITLLPADFYSQRNRDIFSACLNIYLDDRGIDQITVSQELFNNGKLESCGGAAILSHMIASVPTSLDIEHYAEIVYRCSFSRKAMGCGERIIDLAVQNSSNINNTLNAMEALVKNLRTTGYIASRNMEITNPRMIFSDKPHYIWNINGTDVHLVTEEITHWVRFKDIVMASCNFIPIQPKDWDSYATDILKHSVIDHAPIDASDNEQLKMVVRGWLFQRTLANTHEDLMRNCKIKRTHKDKKVEYYFFRSSTLLDHLKKNSNRNFSRASELWVYIKGWGGVTGDFSLKNIDGKWVSESNLWGLPVEMIDNQNLMTNQQEQMPINDVPDDF